MIFNSLQQKLLDCEYPVSAWIAPRQSGKTTGALLRSRLFPVTTVIVPRMQMSVYVREKARWLETEDVNIYAEIQPCPLGPEDDYVFLSSIKRADQIVVDEAVFCNETVLSWLFHEQAKKTLLFISSPYTYEGDAFSDFLIETGIPVGIFGEHYSIHDTKAMESLQEVLSPETYQAEIMGRYSPAVEAQFNCIMEPSCRIISRPSVSRS